MEPNMNHPLASRVLCWIALSAAAAAQTTQRISVGPSGEQFNTLTGVDAEVTDDGQMAVMNLNSVSVVPHLWRYDRATNTGSLAVSAVAGGIPNGRSFN